MALEHFLNSQNRTKFENLENDEILINRKCDKSGVLGYSKQQNSAVSQDTNLKLYTHIHLQVFFYIYPFLKTQKLYWKMFGKHFIMFFPKFQFL